MTRKHSWLAGKRAKDEGPSGRSVYSGLLTYLALVLAAYLLGRSFPATPKARPVPTSSRTICKQAPAPFDAALVRGKRVLITGAAGFIGSHVARSALPSEPNSPDAHIQ